MTTNKILKAIIPTLGIIVMSLGVILILVGGTNLGWWNINILSQPEMSRQDLIIIGIARIIVGIISIGCGCFSFWLHLLRLPRQET